MGGTGSVRRPFTRRHRTGLSEPGAGPATKVSLSLQHPAELRRQSCETIEPKISDHGVIADAGRPRPVGEPGGCEVADGSLRSVFSKAALNGGSKLRHASFGSRCESSRSRSTAGRR